MAEDLQHAVRSSSDPLALSPDDRLWVERTCASLSAEERIAQLFVLTSRQDTPEETAELLAVRPGGIHRFPTSDLSAALRETHAAIDRSEVPPIITGDIEGGSISYPFTTPVPNQLGLAACDDLDLTAVIARIVAVESRALGYDWSFMPVVDLNRAFRSAIVGTRSFGSNVDHVLAQARTYVRELQAHGMAATAKHWPGEGTDDRDQHLVTTANLQSMADWEASFGHIYRSLIDDGVMTVMSAHVALPAFVRALVPDAGREAFSPASVSKLLNRTLLRERLGFRGLIVSDATVMGGLTSWMDREQAVPAVIENGCDVFLFSRDPTTDMALMLKGLREGRLSEARLDEAVTTMLSLKAKLGLHKRTAAERVGSFEHVREHLQTRENHGVAVKAAGQGLTLVKDTQRLLPIDPARHRRVVVIADPGWSFLSGAPDRSFEPFETAMSACGFVLRAFDADDLPTRENTDLLVYLVGQEATPSLGQIHIDFTKLHGGSRKAMIQFNREIPTIMLSFGQPFYLYDAPNIQTYVNAYCSLPINQEQLVDRLVGRAPFTGRSPVDAFCGLEQLRW